MLYLFKNIRAELKKRKWSIECYCGKLGIRRNRFYNWEKANDLPASYLIRTAELFGMSVDQLIKHSTPTSKTPKRGRGKSRAESEDI